MASELSAAGLVAGPITEIGWVVTSIGTSTLEEGYKISMKSTTSTVLTTTFETGTLLFMDQQILRLVQLVIPCLLCSRHLFGMGLLILSLTFVVVMLRVIILKMLDVLIQH